MKKFLISGRRSPCVPSCYRFGGRARCGPTITDDATATFRVTETRGEGGQWYSDFTIKVAADGTIISGSVDVYGFDNGVRLTAPTTLGRGRHPRRHDHQGRRWREPRHARSLATSTASTAKARTRRWTAQRSARSGRIRPLQRADHAVGSIMTAATTTGMNHGEYV